MKIALLEDDPAQTDLLCLWLEQAGHTIDAFDTGKAFLEALKRDTYDMLLLDWNLPDIDGDTVLQRVRDQIAWEIPILFITSRDREADIVSALQNGADDYMTKPVREREVLARVTALQRRVLAPLETEQKLDVPPYQFDKANLSVTRHGEPIKLTQKEYEVAFFLFQNRGRLLSRNYLMEKLWGHSAELNTRTIDTHMSKIRSKLSIGPADGWRLQSVYQHGYRLEEVHPSAGD